MATYRSKYQYIQIKLQNHSFKFSDFLYVTDDVKEINILDANVGRYFIREDVCLKPEPTPEPKPEPTPDPTPETPSEPPKPKQNKKHNP